ncbi:uncharacterized protein BXZ73DRAFT_107429 [Epithele typhae]|uniref:uncharacterized protein n=1 Tax=Epithele typhae TaxID=378194 RepID=UPI002007D592|nr:uncharacterized protein BXZ73DRAFT_107429 [Epithele typhae]KAH9912480.1 hypothetical protein BXZ73DRAFT_107429 [Epithele typhae]
MEHTYQDMRMEDPVLQFTYLVDQFKQRFPKLAYLHVVAPKTLAHVGPKDPSQANFIYDLWAPRHVISTGGYDRESGVKTAEVIGYGMMFLANPDLPFRLKKNLALNALHCEPHSTWLPPNDDQPLSPIFDEPETFDGLSPRTPTVAVSPDTGESRTAS